MSANQKIENVVQIFDLRITKPGTYYEKDLEAVSELSFIVVELHNVSGRILQKPIDPVTFYSKLCSETTTNSNTCKIFCFRYIVFKNGIHKRPSKYFFKFTLSQ